MKEDVKRKCRMREASVYFDVFVRFEAVRVFGAAMGRAICILCSLIRFSALLALPSSFIYHPLSR